MPVNKLVPRFSLTGTFWPSARGRLLSGGSILAGAVQQWRGGGQPGLPGPLRWDAGARRPPGRG